jgi:hypothetical protein
MVFKVGDRVIGKTAPNKDVAGTIETVTVEKGKRKYGLVWENGDKEDVTAGRLKKHEGTHDSSGNGSSSSSSSSSSSRSNQESDARALGNGRADDGLSNPQSEENIGGGSTAGSNKQIDKQRKRSQTTR